MQFSKEKIVKLQKAFNLQAVTVSITNAFCDKEKRDNESPKYINAILHELNKEDIDLNYLELLLHEYNNKLEEKINILIQNKER